MEKAARRIPFGSSLLLPPLRVPAAALESLAPGDLLHLDVAASTRPEWRAAGQFLSHAQPVRQGPFRAARLESGMEGAEP